MRWIRPLVLVLFFITLASYVGVNMYSRVFTDTKAPVIKSEKDELKVKAGGDNRELFKFLTAEDNRDGNLTDQIVIEHMGPMLSDGSRKVSYVVCDKSNNVGRYERKVYYKDYRSPRIYLEEPLVFIEDKEINLLEHMRADDVLDGDITSKIQSINRDLYLNSPYAGTYDLRFQIANTAGDSRDVDLTVHVLTQEELNTIPQIILSDYIVYIEKGEAFDPFQYVKEVSLANRSYPVSETSEHEWAGSTYPVGGIVSSRTYTSSYNVPKVLFYNDLSCEEDVEVYTPGTYKVTYGVNTEDGVHGETVLTVIVEE